MKKFFYKESRWDKFKERVRNPPPERLASIEYKSHFLQILGTMIVTIVLIAKGYWYIIFAFIFSTGVSYSQGISAYQKFKLISKFNPNYLPSIEEDPSPTRTRSRIIKEVAGSKPNYIIGLASFLISLFIFDPGQYGIFGGYVIKVSYIMFSIFLWLVIYYFPLYWICNYIYKHKKEV